MVRKYIIRNVFNKHGIRRLKTRKKYRIPSPVRSIKKLLPLNLFINV